MFDEFAAQGLVGYYQSTGGTATNGLGNAPVSISATMDVNFSTATLSGNAAIIFPGNQTFGFNFIGSFIAGTSTFTGTGAGSPTHSSHVSVFGGLLGPQAEGALMNFAYDDGSMIANGTIAFEQYSP